MVETAWHDTPEEVVKVHSEMAFLPVYGKLGSDESPYGQIVSPYRPIRGSELCGCLFDAHRAWHVDAIDPSLLVPSVGDSFQEVSFELTREDLS